MSTDGLGLETVDTGRGEKGEDSSVPGGLEGGCGSVQVGREEAGDAAGSVLKGWGRG